MLASWLNGPPGVELQTFLSLTAGGKVRCQLKSLYNDGTAHFVFEALDFLARLLPLVPRPRVNLTRYHGMFAPNSARRALVPKPGGEWALPAGALGRSA